MKLPGLSLARWILAPLLTLLVLSASPGRAAEAPVVDDPAAAALVDKFSAYYQKVSAFSVRVTTQVLSSPDGGPAPKSTYAITLRKPSELLVQFTQKETAVQITSDGRTATILNTPPNEYHTGPIPEPFAAFLQRMAPGLDSLIAPDPKASIMKGVTKVSVVGDDEIGGAACRRLRFEQGDSTIDALVEAGSLPLLRRLTIKFVTTGGVVDVRFDDWKIDPKLAADHFKFVPPPGAAER